MDKIFGFLFARPSFTEGLARIFDFGNTLTEYNRCLTPEQADYYALLADWRVVGNDIGRAIHDFDQSTARAK